MVSFSLTEIYACISYNALRPIRSIILEISYLFNYFNFFNTRFATTFEKTDLHYSRFNYVGEP